MPDIDIDFPDDRRHEMIEYTVRRYGTDKVAAIITFGTLGARAAVRDVGRALEVPLTEVDRVARMVPNVPGKPVNLKGLLFEEASAEEWPSESAELRAAYHGEPTVRELLDTAMTLEGQTRHASTHAAGIVISDRPIIEYAPLHRPTKGDDSGPIQKVVQFDMGIVESIGLLKVDFLGLATLSIMRRACEHIERRHGRKLDLNTIPYERCPEEPERDADILAAYRLLQEGNTVGVFQVEGAGLKRVLQEMHPDQFEHIIAAISLYRPGPMEYIPAYIRRMHGEEKIAYHHKALEDILGTTYGICVSGDAIVIDARTGERHRLTDVGALDDFAIQGVNERWEPAVGRVTHWIDSGVKPVYEVKLRNGASIKVTADHRLLTERGWLPLYDLQPGDYIGTPPNLIVSEPSRYDQRRLRVLAYLIGDGSISTGTVVDFVSKDQRMVEEYIRSLDAFENLSVSTLQQVRDVTRVSVAKAGGAYHDANTLLAWMRELGLKYPAGSKPGGAGSLHKFVPDFIFSLCEKDVAFFLASLWDCDGYMGRKLCHYRTISRRLAEDVQTLLLRLGFQSAIYESFYVLPQRDNTERRRMSYQVTVYDTERLAALLQPFMASSGKREVRCTGTFEPTIRRDDFITELDGVVTLSRRALQEQYGIDRQHFMRGNVSHRPRLSTRVAASVVDQIPLPETERRLNVVWQEIVSIEPAGTDVVFDLTVEGLHSFVANNVIVHNCVYQEQIMRMATDIAGYSPGEADLMRRAVSKKKAKDIEYHKAIFVGGAEKRGVKRETAERIYGDIEYFARYGFGKSHAADYAVITVQTAYLKAHYPVEYLCALLEIEFDDTDKVPIFLNECRRLGINVLPPDLNQSGARFTIEEDPTRADLAPDDYRRWAIRVGMGAIKNVGLGAVETIIAEREANGPFASLDEFCTRVDLRRINNRVLECLAKVGCFDNLARHVERENPREIVLAVLDRMVATSGQHHAAADVGQLTMFDLFGGPSSASSSMQSVLSPLPSLGHVDVRARLDAEKELLGLYISDHPLKQVAAEVGRSITCFCGEMTLDQAGQSIVIAGLVTGVRLISTKKGDRMAFVKLEDLQGEAEVVVFPRTYEQTRELLVNDTILLVRGKVEERNERLSVLADVIQRYEAEVPITIGLGSADDEPPPPPFEGMPLEMPPLPSEAEDVSSSLLDSVQHHVTLTLERSADDGADVQRVRRVLDALRQFAGQDSFTLQIRHEDRVALLDFPELKSSWNAHLRDLLIGQGISFELRDLTPDPRARFRKPARV